jgi:hypothetical protein
LDGTPLDVLSWGASWFIKGYFQQIGYRLNLVFFFQLETKITF